ncbi:MAG TPA: hypothetical protein VGB24_14540 [Longimicrobium sp.]|jgi:hypothetical protein|uniref:hypothetical protein n=1 Tax=Longimicrobium sp. TaxID=2029185 RepID=UPI002ED9FB93
MKIVATCFSAALLAAANGAAAQAGPLETRGGMDLLTSAINPVAADSAGVGHRAYGLQITASAITYRILSLNAEGGMVLMSDEAAFTQNTNRGEKTSGVAALIGTLSAGLRTPPVDVGETTPTTLSAGVNLGQSFLHVSRTITDCSDCHREEVDIRAGSFWEPSVTVETPRGALHARYRSYLGASDVNDALIIGFTVRRERRAPPAEAAEPAEPAPR